MPDHQPCDAIKALRIEVEDEKNIRISSWWKTLSAFLIIVFGFGGCTTTVALTYVSMSTNKIEAHRKLIDKNSEKINAGENKYMRLEKGMEAIADNFKEQRQEQKKITEAVHRIEVILAGRKPNE